MTCPGSGELIRDGELFVVCGHCGHTVQLTAETVADVLPLDKKNRWLASWITTTVSRVIDHGGDE